MSERQASTFRQGQFTSAHVKALQILSENLVSYLAEETVNVWGEFDSKGRPVSYKVDILINDANYGSGVIEIDGEIHTKLSKEKKDERRDKHLRKLGLWVEHLTNEQVIPAVLGACLEKHRMVVDEYGGRSPA